MSLSRGDAFLSYLPEFHAKSESESCPLPRSFRVPSLSDFVGSLPDELLLCPVRALRIFLRRTSSLSPRPRSLFVSPRSPSCPLSTNALSYFIRIGIVQSLSLAPASSVPPSTSSPHANSSASPAPSSAPPPSFHAHSVRAMASLRPLLVMFLSRPFSKRPLGVPLQFLHRFIYGTSSLNLLGDFLWGLLLLWVLWCDFILFYQSILKCYACVYVCYFSFPRWGNVLVLLLSRLRRHRSSGVFSVPSGQLSPW